MVFSILLLISHTSSGQIVVTQEMPTQYVEKICGNSVQWYNPVVIGSTDALASFTGGVSGGLAPTMDSGILLSTGSLASSNAMAGPSSIFNNTDMGTPGIPELSAMSGEDTFDGIILQFDIIPTTNQLKVNFMFGSEEYPEWVNTDYNDLMAVFLSGPGFPVGGGQNIAISPNGFGISTNTINNGLWCPPAGIDATNPMFFINNCNGVHNNAMDGFTIMLVAEAFVVPCETYTIRFMIADVIDAEHDSWLFIQENGIYSEGLHVNAQVNYPNEGTEMVEGCLPGEIVFSINEPLPSDHTFDIEWTGTAISGVDYLPLPTSITIPAGETSVTIPLIVLTDGVLEGIEEIVGTFQANICGEMEIIIELHDNEGCCYPDEVFDAPIGEAQQTMVQGQTLADLVINVESGAELVWYSDVDLTTEIPATTELIDQTTYYVTQVIYGCQSEVLAIFVEVTLSASVYDKELFISYPNPVQDILNISYSKEIIAIEVTNMLGQSLISKTVNSTEIQLDMTGLQAGNYLVKISTNETSKTIKVIKQ